MKYIARLQDRCYRNNRYAVHTILIENSLELTITDSREFFQINKSYHFFVYKYDEESHLVERLELNNLTLINRLGTNKYIFKALNMWKFNDDKFYIVRWIPTDKVVTRVGSFLSQNEGKFELLERRYYNSYKMAETARLSLEVMINSGSVKVDKSNDESIKIKARNEFPKIITGRLTEATLYYFQVEAGINPKSGKVWYDLIKAKDDIEATRLAKENNLGKVINKIPGNFREVIGTLIYDYKLKVIDIKPLIIRGSKNKNE